jgi:hypothetical protein
MSAEDCTCAIQCPDYAHCACIYVYDIGLCRVRCSDEAAKALAREAKVSGDAVTSKAALDARVKLDLRGASLAEAAELLAEVSDAEIYVPAHRLGERRELYLEDVSLDTVIRELKLMAVVRPDGP